MPAKATILWAEDDDNDVFFFQRALSKTGLNHQLIRVSDGAKAVDYLSGKPPFTDRHQYPIPHLVLLDLKMPRMGGFDVLAWLKAQPELRAIPALVLSSSNQESDQRRALELGASDYLVKPSQGEALVELVRTIDEKWLRSASVES